MGEEPNRTTARKPGPLSDHSVLFYLYEVDFYMGDYRILR